MLDSFWDAFFMDFGNLKRLKSGFTQSAGSWNVLHSNAIFPLYVDIYNHVARSSVYSINNIFLSFFLPSLFSLRRKMEKYPHICSLNYTDILMQILWLILSMYCFGTMGNMWWCVALCFPTIFSHNILVDTTAMTLARSPRNRVSFEHSFHRHQCVYYTLHIVSAGWNMPKFVLLFPGFHWNKVLSSVCSSRSFMHARVTCKIPFFSLYWKTVCKSVVACFFVVQHNECIY